MTKTKTKRTIWISLIIVVALMVAAIFYYLNNKDTEISDTVKEVPAESSIEGTEAVPTTDETDGPSEFISKYFEEKGRFNAIGVTWQEVNADPEDIGLYIRVKDNGQESQWLKVYKTLLKQESGVNFYSTETPILARGDEYQYKVTFTSSKNEIKNIRFSIINTMGDTSFRFIKSLQGLFKNKASAASWNPANIISRATWGGSAVNASATLWPAQYAEKSTKFVVHHTVGLNYSCSTYTQDEAEADVRAIWQFHTYGNDWGDIGYNYLVDPCGRVFEGRLGGNNVIAGHANPYNFWDKIAGDGIIDEVSIGVSLMGDYSSFVPPTAAITGLNNIIGYKSYINGINPTGISLFKDKNSYNIAGHKNYAPTACPGTQLYAKLPAIRTGSDTQKNNFITDYGNYESSTANIFLNYASVEMANTLTADQNDVVPAVNPAIGEPLKISGALKNNNISAVNLKNIMIIGVLSTGKEVTLSTTDTLTINPGEIGDLNTITYNPIYPRTHTLKITYEMDVTGPNGNVFTISAKPALRRATYKYPSFVPHLPVVKAPTNVYFSSNSPTVGNPLTVRIDIKNYDTRPAYIYSFGLVSTIGTFPKENYVIMPGATQRYEKTATVAKTGKHPVSFEYNYSNGAKTTLLGVTTNTLSTKDITANFAANYSNIYLKVFRVYMENATTPAISDDMVLASTPAIGEPVIVTATLKNNNNYDVVLTNIRVRGRLDSGTEFTVGTIPSLTVPANSTARVPAQTFTITSFRTHSFYIDFQGNGKTLRPVVSPSYSYQQIKAHYPNVKVTRSLTVTPSIPIINSNVNITYNIKNYDARPAYLRDITIRLAYGTTYYYFPKVTRKLAPAETYTYSGDLTSTRGRTYVAAAYLTYGNGSSTIPAANSGVKNVITLKIYTEIATLEGIPIPATSGKTAREQHLNLVAGCTGDNYLTVRESSTHHYTTSGTPVAARNGMAWATSGGCGYGAWGPTAPSVANERYYITMRWNYTNLNGQTILTNKAWYYGKRIVVTNPLNGKKVVAAIIEYGPGIMSRVSGLSPEAMLSLGAVTDNTLSYYWAADQTIPLGPIN